MKRSILVMALVLAGCTAIQHRVAQDSEDILTEAGFKPEPIDEPGLPDRQLVVDGSTYKFADQNFCKCVYVGGTAEYTKLEQLRAQRIADRQWHSRHSVYGNWSTELQSGPWKPEGLDVVDIRVARVPSPATGKTRP